jgi:GT2 family glycosyltransferase
MVGEGESGLVSVVVPNYNGAAFLSDCLESVRKQTYEPLEAIVVDDGSTDRSLDLVATSYPEMRLIALQQNGGFAHAANTGITAAHGEIIALLNNDASADPRWVEELVAALGRHPQAGSAASKILLFDPPNTINSVGDVLRRDGMPGNRGVWETDHGQYDEEVEVFSASGAALAYRRSMLAEVGTFDEQFFMYCEDVDLALRAQLAGHRCIYAPRAVVRHRLSASGGGELASYYCGRNFVWLLARDLPALVWRQYWPRILVAQIGLAANALLHADQRAARARLRGQLLGLLSAPRLVRQRRSFATTRRASDAHILSLLA